MEHPKDELKDIVVGLEQRIVAYETKLKDLKKKKEKINEEMATLAKYVELAKTIHRVEANKAKLASLSGQIISDKTVEVQVPATDVTDQSKEILLGRSKYVGMRARDGAYAILQETKQPMHAKELCRLLMEGGLQLRGKTPVVSIAASLKRDPRFRKVAPNTFESVEPAANS